MAGEWIKVTSNLHAKPEVFKLARLLSLDVDTTVGRLVRFWCWADGVTVDGVVDAVETSDVDAVVRQPGFCDGLIAIGWAKKCHDGSGIEITKFTRHNGESSKKRELKNERQARWRAGKVGESVDAAPSTKAPTREEKRRDNPIAPESPKFAEFWKSYPGPRKIQRNKCLEVWVKQGFEVVGDQIILHVAAMAVSPAWKEAGGKFIPAPLTYLNQRRFEDGMPESARPRLVI